MSVPRKAETGLPVHRFAWDGFSFNVPEHWNLSFYHFDRKYSQVRMEDDDSVRLEMEWVRMRAHADAVTIHERYSERTKTLEEEAKKTIPVGALPAGWAAFLYLMGDGRYMAMCMFLAATGRFFCLFRLHLDRADRSYCSEVIGAIARSFELHEGPLVPWELYDMKAEVESDFRLINTSLQAGRKLLVFQRRLTRLYMWQFSLADMVLKGKSVAQWAAEFLNTFKMIRGVRFEARGGDKVIERRGVRFPLGHYDEIGRWCFSYKVGCSVIQPANAIALWVYNYRSPRDLARFGGSLAGVSLVK